MKIGDYEEEQEQEIEVGFEEDLDTELSQATEYEEEGEEEVVEEEEDSGEDESSDLLEEEVESPEERVERLVAERLANQRVQQERVPTQEEVLAQLKHYVPDQSLATQIMDEDPEVRLAALRDFTANVYQHMYAVTQQYGERVRAELSGVIQPLATRAQMQEKQGFVEEVGKEFPSLRERSSLVAKTMEMMGAQGYKVAGKSKAQILKDVALATGRAIKEVDPSFTLTMKKSGKNPSTSQGRVPTRGSGGGSGKGKAPVKGAVPFHQAIGLFGKP